MSQAPLDQPYRGNGTDRPPVRVPPDHLPLFRARQLRKRWHYVAFWSRELSFCAARASVGPLQQEYWGIWDRAAQQFRERSHLFTRRISIEPHRLQVKDDDVEIDVTHQSCSGFEVYQPVKRAYTWSRKDFCRQGQGTVRYGGTTRAVSGVVLVDINAGYHARHTEWHWAAGAGVDQHGRVIAFNAVTGVFDAPINSERTIWIEGDAKEVGPNTFSEDLSTVGFAEGGTLFFKREALLEKHDNFLIIRSDYVHWFGTYSGMLPGGIELHEAFGVREHHDALW